MEAKESDIWVLGEELMVEILIRVGPVKCTVRCKLVCKFWCSLVVYNDPDSYWLRRWHQINPNKEPAVVALFTTYDYVVKTKEKEFRLRYEPQLSIDCDCDDDSIAMKLDLDFLPCNPPVVVMDSHKDLLLCSPDCYSHSYYLCNPFTKQWTPLPPPPRRLPLRDLTKEEEMRFNQASKVRFTISGGRLSVVRCIPFHLTKYGLEPHEQRVRFWVLVLDRGGDWREVDDPDMLGLFTRERTCKKIVSYRGKMVWLGEYDYKDDAGLFSYDFDSKNYTRLPLTTGFSATMGYHTKNVIGVSEGRLRIAQLIEFFTKLIVWELDDERGEWVVVWELGLLEAGRGSREWRRLLLIHVRLEDASILVQAMAFHPEDGDILYMLVTLTGGVGVKAWSSHIFSCNIRKTRLYHVRTFPTYAANPKIFPVVQQCWPTPVPKVILD